VEFIQRLGKRTFGGYDGVNCVAFRCRAQFAPCDFVLRFVWNYDDRAKTRDLVEKYGPEADLLMAKGNRLPSHPNIATFYHSTVGTMPQSLTIKLKFDAELVQSKTLFTVMDCYPITLSGLLECRKTEPTTSACLTEGEILHIVDGILSGLIHLHQNGIVHRDLKPDNIFLQAGRMSTPPTISEVCQCTPIIADFGEFLDCREVGLPDGNFQLPFTTRHISRGGAVLYLPPEIYDAKAGIGKVLDYERSDAFALGVVAYQMMSGLSSLPYANQDRHVLLPAADVAKSLPTSYSAGLRELVVGLLSAEFSARLGLLQASTVIQSLNSRPFCTSCGHDHASVS